ncbi:hypothetical protein PHLGIDRAFT_283810 [Phlebiopsis gigantea 11061_1 CR5-6]|uniref:Transmembrane protein n=1 Tax=Phlebiopsis gigantea (strain 11061_1 CR5-6) TaxID=745531 RepID=A0A0C3S408_PHLG1|nr:hypothetical protein PHLGIDRAFT_283810 [Phlebiopsis gigantea 11061_1 CR5-6]
MRLHCLPTPSCASRHQPVTQTKMTRSDVFSPPSLILSLCLTFSLAMLAEAAAAEGDPSSSSGGVLTSIKIAMGVVLVFFIFLIVGFCITGRKSRGHSTSALPPALDGRPVARSKSLRSLFSTRSGRSGSSHELRDVALSRPPSNLSLSGETVVDVPWRGSTVTLQALPPAYIPRTPDSSSVARAMHS